MEQYPVGVDPEGDEQYRPSQYDIRQFRRFAKDHPEVRTMAEAVGIHTDFSIYASMYWEEGRDRTAQEYAHRASTALTAAKVLQYAETENLSLEILLASDEE